MNRMTIKKGDNVQILAGKDKGKRGVVEQVLPKEAKVVVGGLNMVKRHMKKTQATPNGGIVAKPAPIQRSNVAVICPQTDKPTRIKFQTAADGTKFRTSVAGVNLDSK